MMGFIKSNLLWFKIVIVSVIAGGLFYSGMLWEERKWEAQQGVVAENTLAQYTNKTEALNTVADSLEKKKTEKEIVYVTLTKEVEKVVTRDVYRNVCLDNDGLRIVNEALAGKPSNSK